MATTINRKEYIITSPARDLGSLTEASIISPTIPLVPYPLMSVPTPNVEYFPISFINKGELVELRMYNSTRQLFNQISNVILQIVMITMATLLAYKCGYITVIITISFIISVPLN